MDLVKAVEAVMEHLVVGLGLAMDMEGLAVVVVGNNMLIQSEHQVGSSCLCIARFAGRTRKYPYKLYRLGMVWENGLGLGDGLGRWRGDLWW
jgi:hypothetical protein